MELTYLLNKQLKALIAEESNFIANLANASALLFENLEDINWAGFYLWDDNDHELILGPFQGKVACVRIENGKGVCGSSFKTNQVQRVYNVHDFPGHIACDAASNSEIVLPINKDGQTIGVLDIDSPSIGRFTEDDQKQLEEFVKVLEQYL